MNLFAILLAYGILVLALGVVFANARGLINQRRGLEKRRRTLPRLAGLLAGGGAGVLFAGAVAGAYSDPLTASLPVLVGRPAFAAVLVALLAFSLSD